MDRIVVGVDGSPHALAAARWAHREAALWGARLEVVQAWAVPVMALPFGLATPDPAMFEEAGRTVLDDTMAQLRELDPAVEVTPRLVHGEARSSLVEAAEGAALVVVGRRGATGFLGLLMGSVSDHVLRHAEAPVAVVPAGAVPGTDVVVGVDGSDGSRAALRAALRVATRRDCRVRAVLAWNRYDQVGPEGPQESDLSYDEDQARAVLQQVIDEVAGDQADRVDPVPVRELPAVALMAEAEAAALVVVGARGLGGFGALLLGSVSTHMAHHAPVPVLVVRGDG